MKDYYDFHLKCNILSLVSLADVLKSLKSNA